MTYVLYRHDDGRWFGARVVHQWREQRTGEWRVLVTYATAPGFTFTRAEWAEDPRLARAGEHEPYRPAAGDMAREMQAARERSATS